MASLEQLEQHDCTNYMYLPGLELGDARGALEPDLDMQGSEGEETEREAVGEEREREGADDARNEEQDHRPLAVPQRRRRH